MSVISPKSEQEICVTCGFCCDGTIFSSASLQPYEKETLPEKIKLNYYKADDKEYFRQPCLYFNGVCSIYDQKKPEVCSSYRCQLLKDFTALKISQAEALETVKMAKVMRQQIFDSYCAVGGVSKGISFYQLREELAELNPICFSEDKLTKEYELLRARCNIFTALLIRHFKSPEDFDHMIEGKP